MSDLLKDAVKAVNRQLLGKAEGGSMNLSTTHYNQLIPQEEVWALMDLTMDHTSFLSEVNTIRRMQKKGTIPIWNLEGWVMEHVGEQDPTQVTSRGETSRVSYMTEKMKCDIVISHEELAEHEAAGLGNFETQAVNSFTTQLNNNIAELAFRAKSSLRGSAATREERALKAFDGVDVLTDAGANVYDANGKAFGKKVYSYMVDKMPWKYRRNPQNLRWWQNTRVTNNWQDALADLGTAMGDRALTSKTVPPPHGIDVWTVPYIPENDGPTAIAPTSVAGTTEVTAVLTTLITAGDPASVAAGVGRQFLITCVDTGQSEVCTGYEDTTLKIQTSGKLGQASVSGTASDYTVRPYDETTIYLGNPKAIHVVWNGEWRSSREYNKDLDQIEITIYMELTVVIPVSDHIVKVTNVAIPPLTW